VFSAECNNDTICADPTSTRLNGSSYTAPPSLPYCIIASLIASIASLYLIINNQINQNGQGQSF
jgi:hypothetical protein